MNYSKTIATCLTLTLAATAFSGCTDEEVATAIGAAVIVGGAVVIGANTKCEGGWQRTCSDWRDRRGRWHTDCRDEWDSCKNIVPKNEILRETNVKPAAQTKAPLIDESRVTDTAWAKEFSMSFDASARFIESMKAARAGDYNALTGLGLTPKDIEALASLQVPSEEGIDSVAKNLDQDKATVQQMMEHLLQVIRENRAALASAS